MRICHSSHSWIGAVLVALLIVQPCRGAPADDPAVDAYWRTHSLVFAAVVGTQEINGDLPKLLISLRPKLRLSGTLDPGKVPEFSAEISKPADGKEFKLPGAGTLVLALVVQEKDTFRIPPDTPAFMPGNHAPICEVKNFSDPKVLDTLHAVQELRKKKKSEPLNDHGNAEKRD